jgi:hypothetical protein
MSRNTIATLPIIINALYNKVKMWGFNRINIKHIQVQLISSRAKDATGSSVGAANHNCALLSLLALERRAA